MRVCLFDIDGTLLSSGGAGSAAMESALLEEFGLPAITTKVTYSGRTDRAIMRDLLQLHGIDDTEENTEKLIAGYLSRLPASLAEKEGAVLPGILALLNDLHARNNTLIGLLTGNIRAGAKVKLGHFGLFDFFVTGGFGDLHWERDDVAREAITEVVKHLGGDINTDDVWVIGDTPLDIKCARAVGARAVAVATGWHSAEELAQHDPDILLNDLSDASALLAFWD